MSAAELHAYATDIVELAALRGREHDMAALAERHQVRLPPLGRVVAADEHIALSVRPSRWLLLTPPAAPGAAADGWRATCNGAGVVVDLSSGLTAFRITDRPLCDAFARACRLDLDPQVFPAGRAAATIVAQVSVILARLTGGMLLLTPSTTARHFREWLGEQVR